MTLPDLTAKPCNECPWRRNSAPGWLGPFTAEEWIELAHSDEAIACHMTIEQDGSWDGARQCKGAADYRANVCKTSRDPEVLRGEPNDHIFGWRVENGHAVEEFIEHHEEKS